MRPGEHPAGDDLERITRTLTHLRAQMVSDPLAFWRPESPNTELAVGAVEMDLRRRLCRPRTTTGR